MKMNGQKLTPTKIELQTVGDLPLTLVGNLTGNRMIEVSIGEKKACVNAETLIRALRTLAPKIRKADVEWEEMHLNMETGEPC
jgi:hypothetical protein